MKSFLKWMFILGAIGAVIVVAKNRSSSRETGPASPWTPPSVESIPPDETATPTTITDVDSDLVSSDFEATVGEVAEVIAEELEAAPELHEAITVAELEGMVPPEDFPPVDLAIDAEGDPVVSELVEPETEPAAEAAQPTDEALEAAADEGMTAPPDEPALDVAINAEGAEVVSELAAPGAEASLETNVSTEEALAVAADEGMTAPLDEVAEDIAINAEGEPVVSELAAPGAGPSVDDVPDFGAMLDEAVAEAESAAPEIADADAAEAVIEPDYLTKYFDELAATPEDVPVDLPLETPATPTPPAENLFSSVEEALVELEPAPIVPPPRRTAESYLDEGNVYFNVGQYGLAVERYTQAIEMDQQLTAAFYNRANAHTRAGEFERALGDYDRALELQPKDADALNNRGMLHLYRANYPAALQDFNGALEQDPGDTTVMVNRGLAHLHGGDAAAALVDFREAARMDDGDAAAQYGAAQAAAALGNRDEAIRHVGRALELDSGYAREAAADPRLAILQGDETFLRLLRQSGSRT